MKVHKAGGAPLHCCPRQEGRCPGGSQALESTQLTPPRYPTHSRKWTPPQYPDRTSDFRCGDASPLEAGSDFRLLGAGPSVPPAGGHVQPGEQKGVGLSPAGRRVYPGGGNPGAALGHQHSPVMHAPLLLAEPTSVQLRPLGYCPQPTVG